MLGLESQKKLNESFCFQSFKTAPIHQRKVPSVHTHLSRHKRLPKEGKREFKTYASAPQRAPSFPAGRKQARVQLPASFLSVKTSEVLGNTEILSAALSNGATGIILEDDSGSGVI